MSSAVCSKAAVGFMQRRQSRGMTLRQTMVLADKGWAVPELYWQLVTGSFRRYGSSFLMLAISLIFLGGVITPLQSVFLTSKTIKTPTHPGQVYRLTDLTDLTPLGFGDSNLVPVLARSAITSAYNTDPQSRLWTGECVSCKSAVNRNATSFGSQYGNEYDSDRPEACEAGGITLGNMSSLPDPFFAQLPSAYNTGLIQQFLPRINSTVTNERISEDEFPSNCDTLPGAFYMSYGDRTDLYHWSIVACMPADQTFSPWKPVRDRQDFPETLYLNISVDYLQVAYQATGFFQITMNTSAGFFELPNYMNGGIPGPLLDHDPGPLCGPACVAQGDIVPAEEPDSRLDSRDIAKRQVPANGTIITSNSSLALEDVENRGPLLTIAIALFGEGSFISDRVKKPDSCIRDVAFDAPNYGTCIGQVPLQGLMRTTYNKDLENTGLGVCVHNGLRGMASLQEQLAPYIHAFYYDEDDGAKAGRISNAFNAAAFLANEAWMTSPTVDATLDVYYDEGADTLVPVISTAGIVTISLLLAADLIFSEDIDGFRGN
ncbi:hypothetical protein CLAFUW4_14196 [Fulvia fulva]|nr:hypothetical protein CLAFUR4_14199 [Fulvia fulva]WPV21802.1 hypothetical protein CLAFUW4_14196 [Fulvia fulva]WPV37335.1 hypothetical protein CLAFUW7_14207 [Fulvia fulva]